MLVNSADQFVLAWSLRLLLFDDFGPHPTQKNGARTTRAIDTMGELEIVALAMHTDRDMTKCPVHEFSQVCSAQSAQSYKGMEHPANRRLHLRSWPRWSSKS